MNLTKAAPQLTSFSLQLSSSFLAPVSSLSLPLSQTRKSSKSSHQKNTGFSYFPSKGERFWPHEGLTRWVTKCPDRPEPAPGRQGFQDSNPGSPGPAGRGQTWGFGAAAPKAGREGYSERMSESPVENLEKALGLHFISKMCLTCLWQLES